MRVGRVGLGLRMGVEVWMVKQHRQRCYLRMGVEMGMGIGGDIVLFLRGIMRWGVVGGNDRVGF